MSVTVTLKNCTSTNVTFGFYNGPGANYRSSTVPAQVGDKPGEGSITMNYADSRAIGAWTSDAHFFTINNQNAITGYRFDDDVAYVVELTVAALTIVPASTPPTPPG
jgi:hypothetical protein